MKSFITSSLIALFVAGSASAQFGGFSSPASLADGIGSRGRIQSTEKVGSIQRFRARLVEANRARDCAMLNRAFRVRNTRSPSRRHALLAACMDVARAERENLRVASRER